MDNDCLSFEDRFNEQEIAVLRSLTDYEIRFIVDGGVACCFHGVRSVSASTNDIDILLCPDVTNAARTVSALDSVMPFSVNSAELALPRKQFQFLNKLFDFRTADSADVFSEHASSAVKTSVHGVEFMIASVASLIVLKQVAITEGKDVGKHTADIRILCALTKEQR